MTYAYSDLSKMIDHSLLVPTMNVEHSKRDASSPWPMMSPAFASCLITSNAALKSWQVVLSCRVRPSDSPMEDTPLESSSEKRNKRSLMVAKNWIW